MHDFLISVKQKDMSHSHHTLSQMWQKQISTEELNAVFISIIDSGANWPAVDTLAPELSSDAKIDENGVLSLAGRYPTTPELNFEMKYIYEATSWKLIGFSLEAK
jgi:hypothetical protein